jgi:predicted nucleic-acid-binding protein
VITIDTNILVRFLINDDAIQHQKAKQLFLDHPIYILKTVLLETEWVLHGAFDLPKNTVGMALQKLLLLQNVNFEGKEVVFQAISYYERGMDFADALHLASSPTHNIFKTFDKKLIRNASRLKIKTVLP